MKKYCLALDLKDDPQLIKEYKDHHQKVWPEIIASIHESGIRDMEIYQTGNRLFMIMEVEEGFTFQEKAQKDAANVKVREWENLMWKYQQALPFSDPGEKWKLMDQIFAL